MTTIGLEQGTGNQRFYPEDLFAIFEKYSLPSTTRHKMRKISHLYSISNRQVFQDSVDILLPKNLRVESVRNEQLLRGLRGY